MGSNVVRCSRLVSRALSSAPALRRPISQPTAHTHAHLMRDADVTPGVSRAEYVARRARLADELPAGAVALFPSSPQTFMSEDVPYLYHPNTDLLYLCGNAEPGAALLVEKTGNRARFVMFVQPKDPTRELWDGPVCGSGDDVRIHFGVDDVRDMDQMPVLIQDALPSIKAFHFDSRINSDVSDILLQLDANAQKALVKVWSPNVSPKSFIANHRLVKSPAEIHLMRLAGDAVSGALNDAMALTVLDSATGSIPERAIEANIEHGCKMRDASRMAFPSVVASGRNGTILHYMDNGQRATHGDIVMVDAGCQVHGYCSDVSRTWPVSGQFSSAQRDLYQLVLSVQKECIVRADETKKCDGEPVTLDQLHAFATRELTRGLLDLGFMPGHTLDDAVSSGVYARYFPHALGHYLGLDVHDVHQVSKSKKLEKGMVVTIEPGLYCPLDDFNAPEAFRGLGMRIEDDVVVGGAACAPEILSVAAVKEIADVEELVGSVSRERNKARAL